MNVTWRTIGLTTCEAPSRGKEPESTEQTPTKTDIAEASGTHLSVEIDGKTVEIEEQIQVSISQ